MTSGTPAHKPSANGTSPARKPRRKIVEKAGAKIREHQLANGLRVLLAERRSDPVVAAMLFYRVGARNERTHEAGISHFLEHMMFKGSGSFAKGEVDHWTTRLGGMNNAFTGYDHTAYWFEFASDRWEKALEIESDRMRGLTLDPQEFDAERAVVLEELSMGLDEPWRVLSERVQAVFVGRHPYRRPIIGYADALGALDPAAMRDYHRRFYHPGNATLVLVGDLVRKDALARVEKHFGSIPAGPDYEASDAWRPALEIEDGERRLNMTWPDPGKRLCVAWPGARVCETDDYALDVVASVLAGGRSARLYRRLVLEEGLAQSVSIQNDSRIDGGLVWLFAECASGVEPQALESALDREIERLCTEAVPAAELKRARARITAAEAHDEETASDLAEELGSYAVDADWIHVVDGAQRIRDVTARDVRDCASRLLRADRRAVGWCLPAEDEPRGRRSR